MEKVVANDMLESFKRFLEERHLRMTEERRKIFEQICTFPKHFDVNMLSDKMTEINYHVRVTTLYNLLELLVKGGLIVRHQWTTQMVDYELIQLAQTHYHMVCLRCGAVREIRNEAVKLAVANMKVTRFTPLFANLYIYGICTKCKNKMKKENMIR